jgi:hypothetical protein
MVVEIVNARNLLAKKKTVVDGGCQRPKLIGKEENGRR